MPDKAQNADTSTPESRLEADLRAEADDESRQEAYDRDEFEREHPSAPR